MNLTKKASADENIVADNTYEKDPRFIEYMTLLLKHSEDERNLVPSNQVFSEIREKYGW